jgi:hypothetical protein
MNYPKGTLDDPVRPKGAGRKRPSIPKVHRQAITYRHHSDERLLWQRGR